MVNSPDEGAIRSARFSVNITPQELACFKAEAKAEGRSVSNLCYQLIQAYLAQRHCNS
jgi:hypothetical protein